MFPGINLWIPSGHSLTLLRSSISDLKLVSPSIISSSSKVLSSSKSCTNISADGSNSWSSDAAEPPGQKHPQKSGFNSIFSSITASQSFFNLVFFLGDARGGIEKEKFKLLSLGSFIFGKLSFIIYQIRGI